MESQRGNVLFLILIAVALFGALSYAVTQSSPSGGGNIKKEQAQLDRADLENYMAALQTGIMRLTIVRGCDTVDFTPPADWVAGDKSCHLFHPDGAGVNYRDFGFDFCPDGTPLIDLNIGNSCGGIVYIGESGGNRIYAASIDNGFLRWGPTGHITGTGTSDGLTNTDDLIAYDIANGTNHEAAQSCRSLGPKWYLPAKDELNLLWTNSTTHPTTPGPLDLTSIGIEIGDDKYYGSSSDQFSSYAYDQRFTDGDQIDSVSKFANRLVRCFRRD